MKLVQEDNLPEALQLFLRVRHAYGSRRDAEHLGVVQADLAEAVAALRRALRRVGAAVPLVVAHKHVRSSLVTWLSGCDNYESHRVHPPMCT